MKLRSALMASAMMALPLAAANAQAINGLYLSGGAGINHLQRETFQPSPGLPAGNMRANIGPAVVMALGWGFGNGLRAEVEASYRQNFGFNNPQGYGAPGNGGGQEQKVGGMANVLYDFTFGMVPMLAPYVGVGVGYQHVIEQNIHATFNNGASFASNNSGKGSFAYQGIVGTVLPIATAPGLGVTAEYRFMGLAGNRVYGATVNGRRGTVTSTNDYNHSFLVGFRYAFNQAPLRAAEPIADLGAKTFLVFFDHNKYDLTSQARGIVQSAAAYSTRTQYTRIDVDGNADTSGSPGYNIGLSQRRAEAVQAELIRDGVPANAIAVHAFGDTKLLVPTGPGVREPQNRRVEIVYR